MKTKFNSINWKKCNKEIARLQEKLTVAYKKGEEEKVIKLRNVITESFWGRALAVRKIITNRGKSTPGVDKEIWTTEVERTKAIQELKENYRAKPLRRI